MQRNTPPRPLDIESLFPELAAHRGTTTRLHPRPGRPDVSQSSVGGPMLWPADEPWPVCPEVHDRGRGRRTEDIRPGREVRWLDPGGGPGLRPNPAAVPTGVVVGNHGELNVFTCPADPGHPPRWSVQ